MLSNPAEIWIDSSNCATNCSRKVETKIVREDNCYIKYNLYEPIYEEINTDHAQIGIMKENNKYYRYTIAYFFNEDFKNMLEEAEEIEITFNIIQSENSYWNLDNSFNNNIILKGHSFENQADMLSKWDSNGIDEFSVSWIEKINPVPEDNDLSFF